MYKHGIYVSENDTSVATPVKGTSGLQVVVGTSPINLGDEANVNVPVLANTFNEAVAALGYDDDFDNFTLCQSMDATFRKIGIAPIVFINVLDPAKHKKTNSPETVTVTDGAAVCSTKGIIKSTVVVKKASDTLAIDADYVLSYDASGNLVVTIVAGGAGAGAATLTVESDSIDPSLVTKDDIIGGYDVSTGKETGFEVLRQVYPKLGEVAGLLVAPKWSKVADVAAVMQAKCEEINGVYRCECVLDCDTTTVKKYTDVKAWKDSNGYTSPHSIVMWPDVKIGSKQYSASAVAAAHIAYTDSQNDDMPYMSPSNKTVSVTATVLADGSEVVLDRVQGNHLNGGGICTFINESGFRYWGNNTGAYPGKTDPKDRWINVRRFFSWQANTFINTYNSQVDGLANRRLISMIVDSENIRLGALVPDKVAEARIEFRDDENPQTDIMNGKLTFHQFFTPYTPAEQICDILEFDPDALASALTQ